MYLKILDHGAPAARLLANAAASLVLALIVAVPLIAVAVRAIG